MQKKPTLAKNVGVKIATMSVFLTTASIHHPQREGH